MHIKRRIGNLDFDGELNHRRNHQNDRWKKQPAAKTANAKIKRNHRYQIKDKSKRAAGLYDGDQPQSLTKVGNLAEKPGAVIGWDFVINYCVMQIADQSC